MDQIDALKIIRIWSSRESERGNSSTEFAILLTIIAPIVVIIAIIIGIVTRTLLEKSTAAIDDPYGQSNQQEHLQTDDQPEQFDQQEYPQTEGQLGQQTFTWGDFLHDAIYVIVGGITSYVFLDHITRKLNGKQRHSPP
ncbi:MAG: hypothetical protein JXJ17_00435 [Anaerolineae bacterium]|nr:hypothetical protein [Anaerolineae bacterium]